MGFEAQGQYAAQPPAPGQFAGGYPPPQAAPQWPGAHAPPQAAQQAPQPGPGADRNWANPGGYGRGRGGHGRGRGRGQW